MKAVFETRLRDFPRSFRALALGYCFSLGFAYLYALSNIALVVGLTPKDIAVHYYGSAQKAGAVKSSGEEQVSLESLEATAPTAEVGPKPSLKNLVAEGHFHLFGMSSFFFGLALLGLFTSAPDKQKSFMVSLPFFLVVVDNLSFMATRFLGPEFSFLTAIAGGGMGLSFAWLWVSVVRELINVNEVKA
ncbi:MAG: hypothetical protein K2X47_19250 [Bdellovibrionales bacterium]|nr:hypothetical protein [Bdellovibrionales bacterium]